VRFWKGSGYAPGAPNHRAAGKQEDGCGYGLDSYSRESLSGERLLVAPRIDLSWCGSTSCLGSPIGGPFFRRCTGVLAEWLNAQASRDSHGDETAWRLKPCPALMFVNGAGEPDQKHDQDLRDTCVMLLDRAGCDLLTICDITGHSYRSAQIIVTHWCVHQPYFYRVLHESWCILGAALVRMF
jgi:hypothetical protein